MPLPILGLFISHEYAVRSLEDKAQAASTVYKRTRFQKHSAFLPGILGSEPGGLGVRRIDPHMVPMLLSVLK